ncbi:CMGC protein kinase [Diaporthe helianthi]|uniref:EKC/KEOPS complex subunit BUD32 n=1 Tax=Diaporthe helianthi TaxID=158607 RepID=A0A2P5HQT9_DIAHE|nr:CMGC protein kinase [Diaporthe helianthi]
MSKVRVSSRVEESVNGFDDGDLDHAPATSLGIYLDGINEGLEPLEDYQDGGFHPVHLGDALGASNRYRVIHKLGHGGFGTVWLCRDSQDLLGYVAVKVMVADINPENLQDLTLTRVNQTSPGAEYIGIPLDSFSITGPNGEHQCIVLPVLGPCVSPRLWLSLKDPVPILRKMAYQSVLAMKFLHENNLCHGDFRPSNILVKLTSLDKLSEDELLLLIGTPVKTSVRTESGKELPTSSPRYLTIPADLSKLSDKYLTDQICIIDLGETFSISAPPEDLGIPENYLPPEVLLEQENAISPACDLWALCCTLFEIREQFALFYMIFDKDELLAEMVRFFGKPPKELWDTWEARGYFFDDQGVWLRHGDDEDWSLEVALSKSTQTIVQGEGGKGESGKSLITPTDEQALMADLLYKLFRWDPEERLTIEEVLTHPWFKILNQQECETEGLFMIIAGGESTASAIRSILVHTTTTPRVYFKLKAEIMAAMDEENL